MKTIKIFFVFTMMFAVLSLSATSVIEPAKSETSAELNSVKQCGVSNAQIIEYLQTCSHHHTVYWVQDIVGTCNSKAGIENCKTATVYVSEGIIVGHTDINGVCD